MKKHVHELRGENREVQTLYKQGLDRKLWKSRAAAARAIGLHQNTFANQYLGHSHGAGVQKTIRMLRKKLDGPRKTSALPGATIRSLYELGKEEGIWKGFSDCGRAIDVTRAVLRDYMDLKLTDLTGRKAAFFKKLVTKMQRKLGKTASCVSTPVVPADQDATTPSTDGPRGLVASTYFDRLLAGVAEFEDQNLDGMRFVLTRSNFRTLKGVLTKEEVADTKLLIEELRRRFNLIAQIDSEDVRAAFHKGIGSQLDELFLAYKVLKEVVPTAALGEIEHVRAKFQTLDG